MTNSEQPECNPTVEEVASALLRNRQGRSADPDAPVIRVCEPGVCDICNKRFAPPFVDLGGYRFPSNTLCDRAGEIYQQASELLKRRQHESQFARACPKLYRSIRTDEEGRRDPRARRIDWRNYDAAMRWDHESSQGLFMRGDSGAGKSTAMWHKLRELDRSFIRWEVFSGQALSKAYFAGMERGKGARDELFKRVATVPVLALDDFGKDVMTEHPSGFLFDVMNARFENCLPILATTRFDSQTLPSRFEHDRTKGEDLVRRIQDYCRVIAFHDQTKEAPLPI